jgi:peptidoglycan hydrolase-like protein with peptidoglycan-binding domain
MATTSKSSTKTSSTKSTSSKSTSHTSSAKKSSHTASKSSKSKHGKTTTAQKSWKTKGQKAIGSDRTREIQEALIREHYLDGEANGMWDNRTQDAMRAFQAKQGWQTKVLPDSRALIKLGLGPDHSDVLNPETAATSPFQPGQHAPVPGGGEKTEVTLAPAAAVVR